MKAGGGGQVAVIDTAVIGGGTSATWPQRCAATACRLGQIVHGA